MSATSTEADEYVVAYDAAAAAERNRLAAITQWPEAEGRETVAVKLAFGLSEPLVRLILGLLILDDMEGRTAH